ncbi:MAG: Zn-ribbon containing protein [Nanoarchaeota archaeon]|nr:Zn-ribbon containing protein [Nanoarchaeota archaeon]
MPHQCVHCSKIIPMGSSELLEGCKGCGGRFFFYIKDEQMQRILAKRENEEIEDIIGIPNEEKKQVEKDIREIAGIEDENAPVILDLESVKVIGQGKFEIDLVNLFRKDRPLIYKMEEGKYIIDLSTTLKNLDKNNDRTKVQHK